jgi:hypothetical protein
MRDLCKLNKQADIALEMIKEMRFKIENIDKKIYDDDFEILKVEV